eukprot:3366701-Prymnesium_polylepis.1
MEQAGGQCRRRQMGMRGDAGGWAGRSVWRRRSRAAPGAPSPRRASWASGAAAPRGPCHAP